MARFEDDLKARLDTHMTVNYHQIVAHIIHFIEGLKIVGTFGAINQG